VSLFLIKRTSTKMREFKWDKPKSLAQIRKELDKGCVICGKPLTNMQGPGSNRLCREHQLEEISYGGYGKLSKPHTFHRADTCQCCGQDINQDPRWEKAQTFFGVSLSETQKNEIKRRYNHGDHNFRKADGGDDSEQNTNAFCSFCHWVKTVINNDGRRAEIKD
jgi:hypothetical protein